MFNIGPTELLVILVIALLVFGPSRLPEVGRTIGKGLREFRKASEEIKSELRFDLDADEPPMASPPSSPKAAGSTNAADTASASGSTNTSGSSNGSGSASSNGAGATASGDHDLPPAAGEAR